MISKATTSRPLDLDLHYQHAALIGVDVIHRPLIRVRGLWIWEQNLIVLREGLTPVQERSTLAHELAHAVLGHRESSPIKEWQADRFAATHLIPHDRFLDEWSRCRNLREVADALQVTRRLALAYAGLVAPADARVRVAA